MEYHVANVHPDDSDGYEKKKKKEKEKRKKKKEGDKTQ